MEPTPLVSSYRKLFHWGRLYARSRWSTQKLEAVQKKKLQSIITFAYKKVPYYRNLARQYKIDPEKMSFPRDITELPYVTRESIQRHTPEMISHNPKGKALFPNRTSGSTGNPILIYMDSGALDFNHALLLYAFWELGFRPWHKCINILGIPPTGSTWWKRLLNWLRTNLHTTNDLVTNARTLARIRPEFVYGFPSYIALLARKLREEGHTMKKTTVISHGETLYHWLKREMLHTFGRVCNTYGCTESYLIGFECQEGRGFHTITEAVFLEVINREGQPAKPGEEGEVVITVLNNYAMPLIRYRIGDRAIKAKEKACRCGRGWPILIRELVGRKDDYFIDIHGNAVSPKSLDNPVFYSTKIKQFQVIQKRKDHVEVIVVKGRGFDQETEKELKSAAQQIKKILGNGNLEVQITYTDHIPPQRSGKLRTFISMVPPPSY